MQHTDIHTGDTLILKADNNYGIDASTPLYVLALDERPGYKVPHIRAMCELPDGTETYGAFRPSDFQRHADANEVEVAWLKQNGRL